MLKFKYYIAYFTVQLRAFNSYIFLLFIYSSAISGTNGSFGLGSFNNEHIDNNILDIVRAGLQLFLRISKQIAPCSFILG